MLTRKCTLCAAYLLIKLISFSFNDTNWPTYWLSNAVGHEKGRLPDCKVKVKVFEDSFLPIKNIISTAEAELYLIVFKISIDAKLYLLPSRYLRRLDLSFNHIQRLENLNHLRLLWLDVSYNNISSCEFGPNKGLWTLLHLEYLNLNENNLTSMKMFSYCTRWVAFF